MSKSIWIVNKHIRPPEYETHFRYIKYAQYLIELGYDVKIFSSSFQHGLGIDLIKNKNEYLEKNFEGLSYVLVKTTSYKRNGLRRIFSLFQFTSKVIKYANHSKKPDIIIHTSNTPFTNKLCSFAIKNKAKYIVEILDLWPESFVSFGLMNANNPLIKIAYLMEKWLYTKANNVVFAMEGGIDYLVEKKWDKQCNNGPINLDKVIYINNSVELTDFEENKKKYVYYDKDLDEDNIFKVVYIGSISLANNVKILVEAAEFLKDEKRIKFYIYGDGSERNQLETYCKTKSISNVIFKEMRIEYKFVPSLLSKSSLNILNFKQSYVMKFGGSQGKLFNYIACGKPICSNVQMGYCLINKHKLGIAKRHSSSKDYADSILYFSNLNKNEYNEMCNRVYEVAQRYDFRKQAQKLLNVIR